MVMLMMMKNFEFRACEKEKIRFFLITRCAALEKKKCVQDKKNEKQTKRNQLLLVHLTRFSNYFINTNTDHVLFRYTFSASQNKRNQSEMRKKKIAFKPVKRTYN